jgi:exonuclease III
LLEYTRNTKEKEVLEQLQEFKIDIGVLSETKKKGNGSEFKENYLFFIVEWIETKRAKSGVGIVVHRKYRSNIKSLAAIADRIITLEAEILGHPICIVGVYARTDNSLDYIKDEFFEKLKSVLDKVSNRKKLISVGDFNGRVGRKTRDLVMGNHGHDHINENGVRLLELCEQFSLKIMLGYFAHKNIHKFT